MAPRSLFVFKVKYLQATSHPATAQSLNTSNPIQSNPIQSNPIQSNPIQSNPIQSNPIQSIESTTQHAATAARGQCTFESETTRPVSHPIGIQHTSDTATVNTTPAQYTCQQVLDLNVSGEHTTSKSEAIPQRSNQPVRQARHKRKHEGKTSRPTTAHADLQLSAHAYWTQRMCAAVRRSPASASHTILVLATRQRQAT
jgi:hypothetical protein